MSVPLPVRLLGAATAGFEQGPPAQVLGDPREERTRQLPLAHPRVSDDDVPEVGVGPWVGPMARWRPLGPGPAP